jgi:asparagine synthase (glutamine-hydrolysing)
MNAIFGIWNRDGHPLAATSMEQGLATLAHRCPDRKSIWIDGPIGLSRGTQTLDARHDDEQLVCRDEAARLTLTMDGRIDNREALLGALTGHPGAREEMLSDAVLALKAYQRWGTAFVERLAGDFALALWDAPERRLVCARDPMGVRPFYYFISDECFAFASEIKALLSLPIVPRRLNERRVADHLAGLYEDAEATFFEKIRRLPPSNLLIVEMRESHQSCYWNPDTGYELRLRNDEAYAEAFREVFSEAVRCRLRGSDPIGSMLSGGLDSSSIACMARNQLRGAGRRPLHTFSAIFPSLPEPALRKIDERPWIEAVAETDGIEPHYLRADRHGPWEDLDLMLDHEDEPFFGPNLYLHWGLHRLAGRIGVRILLDGIDGDTTVSHGLEFLGDLARTGRWRRMTNEARALARRRNGATSTWGIVWQCGLRPLVPEAAVDLWRRARGRGNGLQAVEAIIEPGFGQRTDLRGRWASAHRNACGSMRQRHLKALRSVVMTEVLELVDRSAAAWGVEPRYPFFDRRMIEFCLALPADQKLSQGWTRAIQRRAMEGILPESVRWRFLKSNLSPNFLHALQTRELPRMNLNGATRSWRIWEFMNRPAFDAAVARSTGAETMAPADGYLIHKAVVLNRWLRKTFV